MPDHNIKTRLLSFIALGILAVPGLANAQDYNVDINKTEIVYLPSPAAAVVIGNPEIADVSVHSPDTLFLVGRGYGETNLLVLDAQGQTVLNAGVTVSQSAKRSNVRVFKMGQGRETYNCTPTCQPAPVLGDAPVFTGNFKGTANPINNTTATGAISRGSSENIQFSRPMGPPPDANPQVFPMDVRAMRKRPPT